MRFCAVAWLIAAFATAFVNAFIMITPSNVVTTTSFGSPARSRRPSSPRQGRHPAFTLFSETTRPSRRSGLTQDRQKELLTRKGPYFSLDRVTGTIEFGATAYLVTELGPPATWESIATWLEDEQSLARSIWDAALITELGNSMYRYQVMTLQFVTLQLAPWVDLEMKTLRSKTDPPMPVFCIQSKGFEPNLQVLPGRRISADSLGLVIEVAGQLRPSADGTGVRGALAFSTRGHLPPPLRLLPDAVLQAAAATINDTVIQFAVQNFQAGARRQYQAYVVGQSPPKSSSSATSAS